MRVRRAPSFAILHTMEHPQTFVFFGRSGSGKGTQARLLVEYLEKETPHKALYIETGARFREFTEKNNNFTSELTREVMEHGRLMPEFLPVWVWADTLINQFTGNELLVLDGLSRRAHEAPVLHSALAFYKRENPHIIYLNISHKRAFDMLKSRGRADDTDENINRRLSWFDDHVVPAINYFKNHDYFKFHEIDGSGPIEEVHDTVIRAILKPA